jgi:hypothetical protein
LLVVEVVVGLVLAEEEAEAIDLLSPVNRRVVVHQQKLL